MKNVLFLLIFLAGASGLKAQGSLQFNQARLVTANETVPTGKVWKVTSVIPTDIFYYSSTSPRKYLLGINGVSSLVGHSGYGYSSYFSGSASFIPMPLWFSEGNVINPAVANSYLYGVNIIEFNLVP